MADKSAQPNTYGVQKRHHGKLVQAPGKRYGRHGKVKAGKGYGGPKASTHGGRSQANGGFECGQFNIQTGKPGQYQTKILPGRFRVGMPHGRTSYIDQPGWRHRGEHSRIPH